MLLVLIEPLLWGYASTLNLIYGSVSGSTGLTPLEATHAAARLVGLDESAGFADIALAALS